VGAGPRGREPLILERNGLPYVGFLQGRTRGDTYRLMLLLSCQELRVPGEPGR
jgi:hypothetical protein